MKPTLVKDKTFTLSLAPGDQHGQHLLCTRPRFDRFFVSRHVRLNLKSRTREPPPGQTDFEVSGLFYQVLGRGTGPKRREIVVGFIWVDSEDLATILNRFRVIFDDSGLDRLSET